MARRRMLHPEAPCDEDIATLKPCARLVWAYLPCHADRAGRLPDKPFTLKLAILPMDDVDMHAILDELAARNLIVRYEAGGRRYIAIRNFLRYQHPHKNEPDSDIPPPLESACTPVKQRGSVQNASEHDQGSQRSGGMDPESESDPDPPVVPQGGTKYSLEFLEFWKIYPRKVGKGAAWRAWKRQRPPLEPVKTALAWQVRSADWARDGGQYIPHPATWLTGRRWEDERQSATGPPTNGRQYEPMPPIRSRPLPEEFLRDD